MSDAECDACARYAEAERKLKEAAARDPGETWVILSERECHHVYEHRLCTEIERLRVELNNAKQPTGVAEALERLVRRIEKLRKGGPANVSLPSTKAARRALADHPNAGGKEESA